MTRRARAIALAGALGVLTLASPWQARAAPTCSARTAPTVTPVVELYTSEGCSSCPPADQWLSRLKTEPALVTLAFHVDYWDRLGWKDRFASAAYTRRQAQTQASSGARFNYTPQVLLDGADRPDWPGVSVRSLTRDRAASTVDIVLARDGERFTATVSPTTAAPARLAAYWAVIEQGHVSSVKAGENQGATLKHDDVVREYRPVDAWPRASASPATLRFDASVPVDPAHPREVALVVLNADTGRPVQAIKLGC